VESELFGYERGAFTGALKDRPGKFEMARGGTILLDEIGDMDIRLQAKLLQVLQDSEFQRLGSSDTMRVDVRVVAATNADLIEAVDQGRFRSDLYYRLAAFPLQVPPLRERASDIPMLAKHFLRQIALEARCAPMELDAEAASALEIHLWEGNVRELQQVMERAVILASGQEMILPQHFCFPKENRTRVFREEAVVRLGR
jgi:transcriptional regulator with GAF, ATPase, and Fis domain